MNHALQQAIRTHESRATFAADSDRTLTPERGQTLSLLQSVFSLPRTVWLLAAISLVNDAASDMIYPLVPLYLASVLMAGPKALGIIEGIAEAVSSLIKLVAGVLADRAGKTRAWVIAGYAHRRIRAAADRTLQRAGSACSRAASPIASAKACARRRAMR